MLRKSMALLLLMVVVLAGCAPGSRASNGADPAPDPIADPPADPEPGEPFDGSNSDSELVVYSGRSQTLVGPILEAFEAETGISVAVRWGNTAEVAATLLEEGERSPADVFFAQDPGGLGAVSGMLTALPEDLLDQVPETYRDSAGRWVGISGRARVLVYNIDSVPPDSLPASLQELTDPSWHGRIGWAPTNASLLTMVTAMRQLWGEDETRQWLEGLLANQPIAYASNTPVVAAVGAGEVDIGLVNHYYLYRCIDEAGPGFPVRNQFLPDGGPGSLVMVAGAGVLQTSDSKASAFRLIEYLLSGPAQTYFAEQTHEYPLAAGVEPSVDLPPLSAINSPALDLTSLADMPGTLDLMRSVGALP